MALSAADLQRRHQLEGTPDPFPSLVETAPPAPKPARPAELDTESEVAFPSLASSVPGASTPAKPTWGAAPRIKATVSKAPVFADSFTLSAIDLSNTGKDGKPATLGEVMKQVMAKYKVKIDASGNQKTRQTTFHIKAESQKELDKAKRSLLALLSPVITLVINAPVSTIATIIGPKGATLKQIRDQTSVRVDIPKKDSIAPNGNGHANGSASGKATPSQDDDEEPTVPVTLTGPQPLAYEAQALLNQIILSKTSRITSRVRDIPAHILPFLIPRRSSFLAAAQYGDVQLALNAPAREITASGDREAVVPVVESIKTTIEAFRTSLTSVKITLPKRQHRLLVGKAAEEVMNKSKCAVSVPDHEAPGEEVTVWGEATDLPAGLSAVMEQANSKYIHEFPLPGPIAVSRQLATYFARINYVKTLKADYDNVEVFLPSPDSPNSTLYIDLVGNKSDTDVLVRRLSELIGKLIGATRSLNIDWLLHRVIQGKNAKKLKQYHDAHNVHVFFPDESAESSTVLLVYDPFSSSASPIPDEKAKHLDDVEKDLQKLAKEAADVKTETVSVEKRWHEAVVGSGGTTLNAIIGEDKTLSIKVGEEAGQDSEDVIVVRGVSSDVDRAVKEILKIVEDAKNDEIVNSYSAEFDIEKEYVGRIVGAQGAGVNKLRDQLGVKVDVSDDVDEKEKEGGKKKKVHLKSKVKITGRKENVEEAKKRILTQIERLADETQEILKIPVQYHSSLIGQNGKYAIRLEDKYSVKITFPRQSSDSAEGRTREQLKPDEVLLKGGKKGVAGAKSELLEALEFEKEHNNTATFTVPTRSVARILGRGGASINEIKDTTGAQIDVEKGSDDNGASTSITLRGTKKAISEAKAAILAISEQVTEEATATVTVESKFHRSIIGAGGQGLKDLIKKAGGPSDPKVQAGLIRFPRPGEPGDEVRLRGEPALVAKLKDALEKVAAELRDRVILGVVIPAAQHRAFIGRGGQNLNALQDKFSVQIQFPGSRSYNQVGEPENVDDLADADAASIVKVTGSRASCEAAVADLKAHVKPPPPETEVRELPGVPIAQLGRLKQQVWKDLIRRLRSHGVHVPELSEYADKPERPIPARPTNGGASSEPGAGALAARIDDDADADAQTQDSVGEYEWEVIENAVSAEEKAEEAVWTLKGPDAPALDRAEKLIKDTIAKAGTKTHIGFLTLADRSSFPRIVGTKGANVSRLRDETGAEITVSRENNTIVVTGSESEIVDAKNAILKLASNTGGRRRRDDY